MRGPAHFVRVCWPTTYPRGKEENQPRRVCAIETPTYCVGNFGQVANFGAFEGSLLSVDCCHVQFVLLFRLLQLILFECHHRSS